MENFIKLPTSFITNYRENEKLENLGLPTKDDITIDGFVYINSSHIDLFNESEDGKTIISVSGDRWAINIDFDVFYKFASSNFNIKSICLE